MQYLTPEEVALQLKVEVGEIMSIVEHGKLKAIRIGSNIRIPETELERLPENYQAVPQALGFGRPAVARAKFRVAGSVADGADIWPGRMPYPIKLPKPFMDAMLAHFRDQDVAVGGKFDDPGRGSLGEFIQQKLKIKMNPAVYVAALLIDEGLADASRRGYIRFRRESESKNREK